LRTLDCRRKSAAISSIAKTPRTSITWPKFISDDISLLMASFIVKLAMPTAMNRLPRMLEWGCKSITATGLCSLAPLFAGRGLG
jgi:hypothetical protein